MTWFRKKSQPTKKETLVALKETEKEQTKILISAMKDHSAEVCDLTRQLESGTLLLIDCEEALVASLEQLSKNF